MQDANSWVIYVAREPSLTATALLLLIWRLSFDLDGCATLGRPGVSGVSLRHFQFPVSERDSHANVGHEYPNPTRNNAEAYTLAQRVWLSVEIDRARVMMPMMIQRPNYDFPRWNWWRQRWSQNDNAPVVFKDLLEDRVEGVLDVVCVKSGRFNERQGLIFRVFARRLDADSPEVLEIRLVADEHDNNLMRSQQEDQKRVSDAMRMQ